MIEAIDSVFIETFNTILFVLIGFLFGVVFTLLGRGFLDYYLNVKEGK